MKLRILTYNIHKGFSTFNTRYVLKTIKESLLSTGADILFLQEVMGENNVDHGPQFEFIADTVWNHYSYGKNASRGRRNHGNAILSRYPITFEENLDISTNKYERRGLLHCVIEIPELRKKKLHLFNTHIDLLSAGRRVQIAKIKNRILSHAHKESLIFTGDFNDWSEEVGPWLEEKALELLEAHTEIHGDAARTFPSFMPFLPLDRVYFRGVTVTHCECLKLSPWDRLSDHLPILAEFEVL